MSKDRNFCFLQDKITLKFVTIVVSEIIKILKRHPQIIYLGALQDIRKGLMNLSARILGPNSLVQGALPVILKNTPQKFYDELVETLQNHANIAYQLLKEVRGLTPIMPKGAIYMMVEIDMINFPDINDELDFIQKLVCEQSVFCLPGKCFGIDNFMRIVLTVPKDMIIEACERINEFCETHYKPVKNGFEIEDIPIDYIDINGD